MIKRLFDIVCGALGLIVASPVLLVCMYLIWRQDGYMPFYIADRVSMGGRSFRMVKLRSMIKGADRSGVDSTGANDNRITAIGHFVRRYKLDELTQLWNVVRGDMSLVGPRPNVKRETDLYTAEERGLLDVRPGITDLASIVFSDEGDILKDQADPDIAYNQLIRPWKSRLGLFYVKNRSIGVDIDIIFTTVVAVLSRPLALKRVGRMLERLGAPEDVRRVARRDAPLVPHPPPGSDIVVTTRNFS